MLSLPTKGGPIQLPENSRALRVVLNELTDAEKENEESLDVMSDALRLAKRFDMKGPMAKIRHELHDYQDGPGLLAVACQQNPIDRPLARTALSMFADHMRMDKAIFRFRLSNQKKGSASPEPDNLTTDFLESLTVPGALAFVKAMNDCGIDTRYYWKCYNWEKVPIAFMKNLDHLCR